MQLKNKDEDKEKNYFGYYLDEYPEYGSLYFEDGKLTAMASSCHLDEAGEVELTEDQTREVYKRMKMHFEKR